VTAFFVSSLGDAMTETLIHLFLNSYGTGSEARVELDDERQRKADEYDRVLIKKYKTDFDNMAIFVGVFSASTSMVLLIYSPGGVGLSALRSHICSPRQRPKDPPSDIPRN
jgi:hypothetical protein